MNEAAALDAFIAIREIVRRAVLTMIAIQDPDARYRRTDASAWCIPIVREAKDCYGYARTAVGRWHPSPHDVSQMEIVATWLSWLRRQEGEDALRRIMSWSVGVPVWRIGQREQCSERTVKNRIDRSIAAVIRQFAGADISVELVEDVQATASYAMVLAKPMGQTGPVVLSKVYVYDKGFMVGNRRWRDGREKAERFAA